MQKSRRLPFAAATGLLLALAPAPAATAAGEPDHDARRARLALHQAMGLGTLGALAATGVAGIAYYQQRYESLQPPSSLAGLSTAHLALSALSGAAYLTTATVALTAPEPAATSAFEGLDSVLVHQGLAVLHAAGIVSTVALGLLSARSDPALTDAHRVLGFTTFGLMTASAAVIAIDF